MTIFNLCELKQEIADNNRYEKRLARLVTMNQEVDRIKVVVEGAIININNNQRSFVIYGEPQSGKTEMMIALTAKLLDEGFKIIVILLNDSVQLLGQNLERFQRSGISPSPKRFNEILPPEVKVGDYQWVIFCKKNSKDLKKLIDKLHGHEKKVIIDDEADYATPNSKINKKEKSRINELTADLINKEGIYVGVTATPARLDLNKTHNNQNECWIDYPPHANYIGQDIFFPASLENLPYKLELLPDKGDDPAYLRRALFSFMTNVAFLNINVNPTEENYSFLIHTSGKKADHTVDFKEMIKTFEALRNSDNPNHEKFFKKIWDIADERYPGHAVEITKYVIANSDRQNIVVMNSDKEKNVADNKTATDPTSPFTIVIGGNIVSRGVTFNNLLSMFFTRDVKHKIQQDTYIQRARMFGSRGSYLRYFELTIPSTLYLNWQKCFIFHRLSLESRRINKKIPIWLEGEKISAVSTSSIDKTAILIDRGEMSFDLFEFEKENIEEIFSQDVTNLQKIKALSELLGQSCFPKYLINYIESFRPTGDFSIAIHDPKDISGYNNKVSDRDVTNIDIIVRTRGFIGTGELEKNKYPDAIHHIFLLFNDKNKARIFYKYEGNIRFLKTSKRHD
jgi:hypothetical protein